MSAANGIDRISEIYNGRSVFLSGASGFVGKAFLEKILRSTNVKRVYVLIRQKKGKTAQERLEQLFDNWLFKTLLTQKPNAVKRCFAINGDVGEKDLGISYADRQLLINEANFIIHSAATTRFDDSVKYAVTVNAGGAKYMLDLAEQCKNLILFVHVSTAYAFPSEVRTLEKEYRPFDDPHEVLNRILSMNEDSSDLKKKLLGKIPNSYTYSKALAETLAYEKRGKIPLIICRPAVVIPSFEDPIPGWFNNLQGPMGLFVAAGKGVLRSMYMDSKSYANMVPIDSTVSAIMVFSWYYLKNKKSPYIFNLCVPQNDVRLTWEEIMILGREIVETKVPFNGILWYPGGTMTKSKIYNKFNFIFFQLIPAIFIDALLFILRYPPILYKIQMRIQKGAEMFEFYTTRAWDFETTNLETIRENLTESERKIYILKPDKIDLGEYLTNCMVACRRYYLKETDEMIPAAKRNMKIMFVLDRLLKIGFFILLGYYLYRLFGYILG